MTSLESKVLYALWNMYQQNEISDEQKGWLKDLLIRKDSRLYSQIYACTDLEMIRSRLFEVLHYQGSPRDFETESTSPVPKQKLSICCNTPTTVFSLLPIKKNRTRFLSSNNETEIQTTHKVRAHSFHNQ